MFDLQLFGILPAEVWFPPGPTRENAFGVPYNGARMKAYVYVSLKKSVLDPQGKTIQGALKKMGYKGLGDVRQGKYFELTLDGDLTKSEAQSEVERIAREVLTNPVIEEYRYSLEE
jgi:phosphoribosylformylglycinamidine synthase subunit PurS